MRAVDVMVRDVVTVCPDTDVAEAIKLLAEHDVSALSVLDDAGNLVGMLSEADLIQRVEIGTEKRRPWRQEAMTGASTLAADFAKSHGKEGGEVMATGVISVSEDTPLVRDCGAIRAQAHQTSPSSQRRQARRNRQPCQLDPSARNGDRPYGPA
jgi:CBS domain-containing protein